MASAAVQHRTMPIINTTYMVLPHHGKYTKATPKLKPENQTERGTPQVSEQDYRL